MLIVFIPIYIAITLAIGFWASRRIKTTTDFTLAGKSLSTSFVGVTIFATWFGAVDIMGNPGRFVENGFISFVSLILSGGISLVIIGYFFAKKLYKMNIVTVGDFIKLRFNKNLDLVISIILVMSYFTWIAAQFVALSILFQNVLGIPSDYGIILSALIVVIYTYVGGMWAVSYTDMLQSVLILIGLVILLFNVLDQTGGISPLFVDKPASFYHIFPDNNLDAWSEYIAVMLAFCIGTIPVQEVYQRLFSAKSARASTNGAYLASFLLVVIPIIPLIIALGAAKLQPELATIDHGQNLIPAMVNEFASMPVQILFYGALISAILSTSSGAMLSPATIIGENLIKPYMPKLSDKKLLLFTRISVIVVAAISCVFAYNDADIVGLGVASLSLVLVCIFAPFTFGLFWKKSSAFGAWCAIIFGGFIWLFCYFMDTQIAPTIYGTFSSCIAMIVGSLWRPDSNNQSEL